MPRALARSGGHHLGALDGIRGLAAVAVVVTHVGFQSGASFRGIVGAFAARAEIGVAIFFVLSGFLLYRPFAAAHADGRPTPAVGRFLWRRALRIYPAYLVVVTVVLLVHHRDDLSLRLVGGNLLLLQTYGSGLLLPELAQSWTLSTEVAWYLALPVLGALLLRRPTRRSAARHDVVQIIVCGVLVGGSVAYAVVSRGTDVLDAFLAGYWLPHYLGWFALGMALAILHVRRQKATRAQWVSDLAAAPLSCWALGLVLYAIACTPVAGPRGLTGLTVWEGLAREGLYAAVAVLVILPAVFGDPARSLSLAVLGSRPSRYLGDISYALYLWHFPLLPLAFRVTGTPEFGGRFWLNLLVLLAISIPVAALSWHLVESPALRAKSWRPGRRTQSLSAATATEATTAATAPAASS